MSDQDERQEVLDQVDRLEQAIDQMIFATRSERRARTASCDLAAVVSARCLFWAVLADEQSREVSLMIDPAPVEVTLSSDAVEAMVDAIIGNVFAHTAPGTGYSVTVVSDGGRPLLEVSDDGPGLPSTGVFKRGVSGAGSTGLGLDIVRRTAELTGGSLEMNDRPGGGAVIRVWLGPDG